MRTLTAAEMYCKFDSIAALPQVATTLDSFNSHGSRSRVSVSQRGVSRSTCSEIARGHGRMCRREPKIGSPDSSLRKCGHLVRSNTSQNCSLSSHRVDNGLLDSEEYKERLPGGTSNASPENFRTSFRFSTIAVPPIDSLAKNTVPDSRMWHWLVRFLPQSDSTRLG